jgi:hypothetical protein
VVWAALHVATASEPIDDRRHRAGAQEHAVSELAWGEFASGVGEMAEYDGLAQAEAKVVSQRLPEPLPR